VLVDKMTKGKYFRSVELRRKLSDIHKALHLKHPELGWQQSVRMKEWYLNHPDAFSGVNNPMYGRGLECSGSANPFFGHTHSLKTRRRMSESHLGKRMPDDIRNKISETKRSRISEGIIVYPSGKNHHWYGRCHSAETKMKIGKANFGRRFSSIINKKKGLAGESNPFYGKKHSEESLRKMLKTVNRRPNKFEIRVKHYLDEQFPNEWKYCGDGSVIINGHCPDFINSNGQKKIILANGVFWHAGCNKPSSSLKKEVELMESKPYNEFGFKVWFIWEDDFNREMKMGRVE